VFRHALAHLEAGHGQKGHHLKLGCQAIAQLLAAEEDVGFGLGVCFHGFILS
jgi:hypothetical protein